MTPHHFLFPLLVAIASAVRVAAQDLKVYVDQRTPSLHATAAADSLDGLTLVAWTQRTVAPGPGDPAPPLGFALLGGTADPVVRDSLSLDTCRDVEVLAVVARRHDFLVTYACLAGNGWTLYGRSIDRDGRPGGSWILSPGGAAKVDPLPRLQSFGLRDSSVRLLWKGGATWRSVLISADGGPIDTARDVGSGSLAIYRYGGVVGTLLQFSTSTSLFVSEANGAILDSMPLGRFRPAGLVRSDRSVVTFSADSILCFAHPSDSTTRWSIPLDTGILSSTFLLLRREDGGLTLQWSDTTLGWETITGAGAVSFIYRRRATIDTAAGRLGPAVTIDSTRCLHRIGSHPATPIWSGRIEFDPSCGNAGRHAMVITSRDLVYLPGTTWDCASVTFRDARGLESDSTPPCPAPFLKVATSLQGNEVRITWSDAEGPRTLRAEAPSIPVEQHLLGLVADDSSYAVVVRENGAARILAWPAARDEDATEVVSSSYPVSRTVSNDERWQIERQEIFNDGVGFQWVYTIHNFRRTPTGLSDPGVPAASADLSVGRWTPRGLRSVRMYSEEHDLWAPPAITLRSAASPSFGRHLFARCASPRDSIVVGSPFEDRRLGIAGFCGRGSLIDFDTSGHYVATATAIVRYVGSALVDSLDLGPAAGPHHFRRLTRDLVLRWNHSSDKERVELVTGDLKSRQIRQAALPLPDTSSNVLLAARKSDSTFVFVVASRTGIHCSHLTWSLDTLVVDSIVSETRGTTSNPSATFVGDTLLIVWEDFRNGWSQVYGRRLLLPLHRGSVDTAVGVTWELPSRATTTGLVVSDGVVELRSDAASEIELRDLTGRLVARIPHAAGSRRIVLPEGLRGIVLLREIGEGSVTDRVVMVVR